MLNSLRKIDPTISLGILLSLSTSIILLLRGQNEAISILIGLVITAISIMIRVLLRIKESEENLLKNSALDRLILADPALFSIIQQITSEYEVIESHKNDFFTDHANKALLSCREKIHGLAEGRLVMDADKLKITYGRKAEKTVNLVTCYPSMRWKNQYGKYVMRMNMRAIARGVAFSHVWVSDIDTLTDYKDILFELEKIGINVRVALSSEVPRYLIQSYRIIDERKLIKLEFAPGGVCTHHHVIIDPIEVEKASANFQSIKQFGYNLSDFFQSSSSD